MKEHGIKIESNEQFIDAIDQWLKSTNNVNRHMLGFVIGEDLGSIVFTYWYDESDTSLQRIQYQLDIPCTLDFTRLFEIIDKEEILMQFVQCANSYGSVKSFLEFQPNFKHFYKQLK